MPAARTSPARSVRDRILAVRDDLDENLTKHVFADGEGGTLVEQLVEACEMLVAERRDPNRPLRLAERRQLKRIVRHATALGDACGTDAKAAVKLVGGWAIYDDLASLPLERVLRGVCALAEEAQYRLDEEPSPVRHRPTDNAFREFMMNVVAALTRAGEDVHLSRNGNTLHILRLLLRSSGQPVPKDLFRHLQAAVRAVRGREQPDVFSEFDS